jgi:hypothetical protein
LAGAWLADGLRRFRRCHRYVCSTDGFVVAVATNEFLASITISILDQCHIATPTATAVAASSCRRCAAVCLTQHWSCPGGNTDARARQPMSLGPSDRGSARRRQASLTVPRAATGWPRRFVQSGLRAIQAYQRVLQPSIGTYLAPATRPCLAVACHEVSSTGHVPRACG